MSNSNYTSQKELFKSAYRAERAAKNRRGYAVHTALYRSITSAYFEAKPELMMTRLFYALRASTQVSINKKKPDFKQSRRLRDAFAKSGGVL